MVSGRHKSRTYRRVYVKTPGAKNKIQYRKRKPSKASCAGCGKALAGVPRKRPNDMKNTPKSSRRPERPYGGVLCSACSRKKIKESTKQNK